MPSRTLETVLTARNLLSPTLSAAARDVEAFDAKVTAANARASESSAASARAQETSAGKIGAAQARTAETASASSAKVVAANARAAESARAFADVSESAAARAGVAFGSLATKALPLAAAAAGVVFGKMAADFQTDIVRLETTAGESAKNLGLVSRGILNMTGQVGASADTLAKAMYTVDSANIHGADSLIVLKAAAEGAKQEQADMGHVVDAVTTSLHDYHLPASEAAKVTSELIAAVSHGKTTFDELTAAMHSVEPRAAAAHLSLAQTAGALAAMTASGMHAQQAADNLGHTLQNFERPSQPMINAMANVGVNALTLRDNLGKTGVAGAMQELSDAIIQHMDPATRQVLLPALNQNKVALGALQAQIAAMPPALAKLSRGLLDGSVSWGDYRKATKDYSGTAGAMSTQFLALYKSADGFNSSIKGGGPAVQSYLGQLGAMVGTSDALNVALQLTGENAGSANAAIAAVAHATGDAHGNIEGWSEVQQTLNQQLAEAGAEAKSLAIEAGQHLLPVLTTVVGWIGSTALPGIEHFGHGIGDLWHWFTQLPTPVKDTALALGGLALANKIGLIGALNTVTGKVAGTFTAAAGGVGRLSENMALQQRLAQMEATSISGVDAALGGLSGSANAAAGNLSRVQLMMRGWDAELAATAAEEDVATASTGRLAGALGVLSSRGMAGVAKAGGGLMSMIGGPWGLALLAGFAGWEQYSQGVDDVKQAMSSAKTTGQELFNTYVKLGTIYGNQADAARQSVISQQAWAQAALDNGVSQATLTAALRGNAKAQAEVEKAAEASSVGQSVAAGNVSAGLDMLSGKFKENGSAAREFFNNLGTNTTAAELFMSSIDDTKSALEDYQTTAQQIFGPGNIANRGMDTLTKGMDELARSTGSSESSLQGITDILAGLTGAGVSAAQAAVDVTTATIDTTKAFAQMSQGAVDAKGNIDLSSEAGVGLWNSLKDVSDGFKTAVNDSYAAAGGINNAGAASAAAGKTAQTLYEKFILTATGAGMSQTAAEQLAKQLGLVPGDVVTKFTQPGMTESQGAADLLKQKVLDIPDTHTVHTSALTAEATQELQALGFTVKTLPDGTVDVTANTTPARQAIAQLSNDYQHFAINVGIGGTFGHYAAASGAILPGYTPGRDVHRFISPTAGMALDLSGGEGIARPEVVQAMGADRFMGLNRAALSGGVDGVRRVLAFAGGGFFPGMHMTADVGISPASMAAAEQAIKGMFSFGGGGSGGLRPLGRMIADNMGVGSQFGAIDYIFTRESGWNPLAQNPTSTAFGIPQFLASTWAAYGGRTTDPTMQIRDGILYMENRYGSPNAAAAFWAAHHWYDQGGILPPGLSLAMNGTGSSEHAAVFTNRQWDALQGLAAAAMPGYGATVAGGGSSAASGPVSAVIAGPLEFNLYDADGALIGRMRGEARKVTDGRLGDWYRKKAYR